MARGSIRQRSKIRKDSWTVQVYLGVDSLFGNKRYLSESVKGPKANAERRMTELLREIDTGSYSEPSRVTVAEYLKEWLGLKVNVSQRTLEGYEGNVERYIIPMIGNITLENSPLRRFRKWSLSS